VKGGGLEYDERDFLGDAGSRLGTAVRTCHSR
jgi:hypothetical protein